MNPSICRPVKNDTVLFKMCTERQIKGGYTTVIKGVPKALSNCYWTCNEGCNAYDVANLSQLYYTDIGMFYDVAWETGVETVIFTFHPDDDLSSIRLE